MERDRGIVRMIKKGATYQEVGDAYNISRQRVHQIFRRSYPQPARQELDKEETGV